MADRKITVQILGDASSLNRALGSVGAQSKITFGTMVKGAVVFSAVQKAQELLGSAVRGGIAEWKQQTTVAAQTQAVLKSTGGVANVTAKHVDTMSTALMKKTGVDDELIASGENLLLTFKNVHNEVGKGNAVFDRATVGALDLSRAGFGSVESASKMLGKALNDPVKGMTALSRAGVTFSADQKKAIAALVESGDVLGAQKLILKEVESQVGGSAAAYGKTLPGMIDIAKNSFSNFTGELVTKAIPALQQMAEWVKAHLPEISAAFTGAWATIRPMLAAFGEILVELGQIVVQVVAVIRTHWGTLEPMVKESVAGMTAALSGFAALLRGDWSAAWRNLKDSVVSSLTLQQLLTDAALKKLKSLFFDAFSSIKTYVGARLEDIVGFFSALPGKILGHAKSAGSAFVDGISSGLSSLGAALKRLVLGPLNAIISAWNGLGIPSFGVKIPVPGAPDISFSTPSISLPDIPHLAAGGIVRRPTLAMIGESGPEAVIPLGRGRGGGGFTWTGNVVVNGSVMTDGQLVEKVRRGLATVMRDNPSVGFA